MVVNSYRFTCNFQINVISQNMSYVIMFSIVNCKRLANQKQESQFNNRRCYNFERGGIGFLAFLAMSRYFLYKMTYSIAEEIFTCLILAVFHLYKHLL